VRPPYSLALFASASCRSQLSQTGFLILASLPFHEMYHSHPQLGQDAFSAPGEGQKRSKQFWQRTSPTRPLFLLVLVSVVIVSPSLLKRNLVLGCASDNHFENHPRARVASGAADEQPISPTDENQLLDHLNDQPVTSGALRVSIDQR
jgi:hypothetical protein